MTALIYLVPISILSGLVATALLVWAVRSGQYADPEGDRYRGVLDRDPVAPADTTLPEHMVTARSGAEKTADAGLLRRDGH